MTEQHSQDLFKSIQFNDDESVSAMASNDNESEPINKDLEATEETIRSGEKSTKFPLTRIKTIMKLDPELNLVSQESVVLVAKATEMFLAKLAQETYSYTSKAKRKTVQRRDLDTAIENSDALCFLEGALD